MKKLCKPILLETKDEIGLGSIVNDPTFGLGRIINKHGEDCYYSSHSSGGSVTTPWMRNLGDRLINYHLYIISDDEIKEGDWYLTFQSYTELSIGNPRKCEDTNYSFVNCKKVIASTDISLGWSNLGKDEDGNVIGNRIGGGNGCHFKPLLPKIHDTYIQLFIEQYNKGKVEDIEVEYDEYPDTKDGYIIIHPVKSKITWKSVQESLYNADISMSNNELRFLERNYNPPTEINSSKPVMYTVDDIINDIEKAMIEGLDIGQYRDLWINRNKKK